MIKHSSATMNSCSWKLCWNTQQMISFSSFDQRLVKATLPILFSYERHPSIKDIALSNSIDLACSDLLTMLALNNTSYLTFKDTMNENSELESDKLRASCLIAKSACCKSASSSNALITSSS